MKVLKTLAVIVGIIFLVSIILKMMQKAVKTSIEFNGINKATNTANLRVYGNGKLITSYNVPLSVMSEQTYSANDFRVKVSQLSNLVVFRVYDDQNKEVANKPVDKNNAPVFIIYSE